MSTLGRMLLVTGGVLMLMGILLMVGAKVPFLGKLPGDLRLEGRRVSFYFPIVTCLVLSIVLTVLVNLIARLLLRR